MIELSLQKCTEILAAKLVGADLTFRGASNDTRTLQPGNLYIAIKGERLDGHDYLAQGQEKGAVAVLVSRQMDSKLPQIIVADTTIAMGQLAKYWRQQFTIPIVGVTGSCGKTTTTRMIAAILQQMGNTLMPEGNKNNQWGVPQTLFNLSTEHQYAVIEMGADRGGEIKYLANIVQPDVALITNVAPVHLTVSEGIGFGSIQGVFQEKSEIFRSLHKHGTAIVNADDDCYPQWQKLLGQQKQISFGYAANADVTAKNLHANAELQYGFTLVAPQGEIAVQLSSLGKHNVANALAASAAALALGASLTQIQHGLANVPRVARRMIKHQTPEGAILIDDSYNSNLKSAKAVLDMLADSLGKRIAILGDMTEIGEQSAEFHRQVGEYARQKGIDYLFAFGPESIAMQQAFGDNAQHYLDVEPLVMTVKKLLDEHTILVIKGSNSTGMDRIVNALLE